MFASNKAWRQPGWTKCAITAYWRCLVVTIVSLAVTPVKRCYGGNRIMSCTSVKVGFLLYDALGLTRPGEGITSRDRRPDNNRCARCGRIAISSTTGSRGVWRAATVTWSQSQWKENEAVLSCVRCCGSSDYAGRLTKPPSK